MVYKLVDSTEVPLPGFDRRQASRGLRSRQPFSLLYHCLIWAELVLVELPLRALVYLLLPHLRPHVKWTLSRSLLTALLRSHILSRNPLFLRSGLVDKSVLPRVRPRDKATAIWIQPVNRQTGLKGDLKAFFDAGACVTSTIPAYWYGHNHNKRESGRRAAKGEKVYLFFHGGGYYDQSAHPSNPVIKGVLNTLLKASSVSPNKSAPRCALATEYRLSDETTFPGILADALASWMHLVRLGFQPEDIVIAGDSAGANLALSLARYIRDYRPLYEEMKLALDGPIADSLILFSPWVDVSLSYFDSGPSSSAVKNASVDFLNQTIMWRARNDLIRGLPAPAVTSRWLSSLCKLRESEEDLFDGFPRALVFGASLELLIDEIRALSVEYKATAEAGRCGKMTYVEEPLAVHDWCVIPFTYEAEKKRTVDKVASWV